MANSDVNVEMSDEHDKIVDQLYSESEEMEMWEARRIVNEMEAAGLDTTEAREWLESIYRKYIDHPELPPSTHPIEESWEPDENETDQNSNVIQMPEEDLEKLTITE